MENLFMSVVYPFVDKNCGLLLQR